MRNIACIGLMSQVFAACEHQLFLRSLIVVDTILTKNKKKKNIKQMVNYNTFTAPRFTAVKTTS